MAPSTAESYTPWREYNGPNRALSDFAEKSGNCAGKYGNFAGKFSIATNARVEVLVRISAEWKQVELLEILYF